MIIPALTYLGDISTSQEAIECLRRDLVSGETVCEPAYRARIWKTLLLSRDGTGYDKGTQETLHDRFRTLEKKYLQATPDETFDPLSDSESWTTYFQDQELRKVIVQDCLRILPEEDWFQDQVQQKILLDCLFLWAKANPTVSYRQGMHELAGIIVWVTMHDSDTKDVLLEVYALFEALMSSAKTFYTISKTEVPDILNHTSSIQSELLPVVDHKLSTRLFDLGIEPQLYCMKWMRLLFSREFPFHDVLVLWDLIFAADPSLKIIDYICCAMIMRVRQDILENDYNLALTTLMRYPYPKTPPSSFLQDALHLRNFFSPVGGSHIIERYHEGALVNTKPLELNLKTSSTTGYTIGALLERTDALGLNGYVRVAVEEVRRNVTPLLSETKHVLARTHSRDHSTPSSASGNLGIQNEYRDRELATIISTAVANLRRGDKPEVNLHRLDEVKLVLQGRKTLSQIAASVDPDSPQLRPSSAPQAPASSSAARRALSPIRMPAIRSKARSPARSTAMDIASASFDGHEDIPLSVSPKRSSLKKAADFPFLFGEEPVVSTFNRPRRS